MKRLAKLAAIVLGIALGTDQLVQYTALADGVLFDQWVIPFDPPLFTQWQEKRVEDIRAVADGNEELGASSTFDAQLGWCPRAEQTVGAYVYDWSGSRRGSRPLPREKPPGVRRIVAVGGSFTQGAEVLAEETWTTLLERGGELEVANLGVAGYGVDQAFLRLRRDGLPLEPDEVWLGFMPEATMRITTHFPPVYRHWSSVVAFKPLFQLGPDDALVLVENPATDRGRTLELLGDQRAFLEAVGETDRWIRRTPEAFAPRGSSWTHWFATSRLAITAMEGGGRTTAPHLEDPDSEVRRLMTRIIREIEAEAGAVGARFRLLVLPSRTDLQDVAARGTPYWADFVSELASQRVEVVEATPALLAAGAAEDDRYWMPLGHYSPLGNRLVADALREALTP